MALPMVQLQLLNLFSYITKKKPTGIIWVQFDHNSVGEKTRYENRQLYTQTIGLTWTPIKPVTVQFNLGRTKAAQVVRKQFFLRPAAAKTIHRSQGDTETRIVVNFSTKKAIPPIHYVGLRRVTNPKGLYVTDLTENKITVSSDVKAEMKDCKHKEPLSFPFYLFTKSLFKICFLNARSLHKHIEDVCRDYNFNNADLLIFAETRFSSLDNDSMYVMDRFTLFRNDNSALNARPFGGTAIYSWHSFLPSFPYDCNTNGIEITVVRLSILANITIIAAYHSPKMSLRLSCHSLIDLLQDMPSRCNVIIGDFNVNWMNELERRLLHNLFVTERKYKQLISHYTTDNRTVIDHIYTNIPDLYLTSGILETYFTDHKESGYHFHLLSINENFPEIQHYLPKICSHYFLLH